jgi:hypothetical protein
MRSGLNSLPQRESRTVLCTSWPAHEYAAYLGTAHVSAPSRTWTTHHVMVYATAVPTFANSPNLLVYVRPCAPFTILLATSDGGHSHTNVCCCRGLLPLPLLDSTTYYQTCFVNPYASEMFIMPQAIINSSAGSFDKWQMEGFLQGHPVVLSLYFPLGLLKMSIQLSQQDGLYYSSTNTFTVDTNPRAWY